MKNKIEIGRRSETCTKTKDRQKSLRIDLRKGIGQMITRINGGVSRIDPKIS